MLPLLLGLIVHAPGLQLPLLAEDHAAQLARTELDGPWQLLAEQFFGRREGAGGFYRPLVGSVLGLEAFCFGAAPLPLHLCALLAYALCCSLTTWLCLRLGLGAILAVAVGAMLTFSPLAVEQAEWVTGQDGSLPMLCTLGACILVLGPQRRGWRWWVALCSAGAMFGKEWGLGVPLLVTLLYGWRQPVAGPTGSLRAMAPCWAALPLYLLLRIRYLGELLAGYPRGADSPGDPGFGAERWDMFSSLVLQLRRVDLEGMPRLLSVLALLGLCGLGIRAALRRRLVGPGLLLVLAAWLLGAFVLHAPVHLDAWHFVDARYLFAAQPPWFVLLAIAAWGLARGRAGWAAAGLGLLMLPSLPTLRAVQADWRAAGDLVAEVDAQVASARAEGLQGLELIGLPNTVGAGRVGFGLQVRYVDARNSGLKPGIHTEIFVTHRGLRHSPTLLNLLARHAAQAPARTRQLVWDRHSGRFRDLRAEPDAARWRAFMAADPARPGWLRPRCPGGTREAPAQRGEPGLYELGLVATPPARRVEPWLRVDPGEPTRLLLQQEPRAFAAVFAGPVRQPVWLWGFGDFALRATTPLWTGYLDAAGYAALPLPGLPRPDSGLGLQAVFMDRQGRVAMSACLCAALLGR